VSRAMASLLEDRGARRASTARDRSAPSYQIMPNCPVWRNRPGADPRTTRVIAGRVRQVARTHRFGVQVIENVVHSKNVMLLPIRFFHAADVISVPCLASTALDAFSTASIAIACEPLLSAKCSAHAFVLPFAVPTGRGKPAAFSAFPNSLHRVP
jgi:hypothetical protein